MGKRKPSTRSKAEDDGPNLDVGRSRKRIRDYEDVAGSDDEFHLNRDKVLLDEEPDAKRARKWQEQEEFLQLSDEEILGYSESDEVEDEAEAMENDQQPNESGSEGPDGMEHEDGEDSYRWGTTEDDMYGADGIETEEQALEEVAEASRLQQKHSNAYGTADFGFDQAESQDDGADTKEEEMDGEDVMPNTSPQAQLDENLTPAERLILLKDRYPLFEPLSKELLDLKGLHVELSMSAQSRTTESDFPHATTRLRALSAYLGALTMYFTLLTSPASTGKTNSTAISAAKLGDHPIMNSIVRCRDIWSRANSLPADPKPVIEEPRTLTHVNGTDQDGTKPAEKSTIEKPFAPKSRAQRHAEAAQAAEQARKAERLQRTEADLAGLDALIAPHRKLKTSKSRRSAMNEANESDAEDEAPITAKKAAEKAKRKKSLRFYTSQIAQKANKRGAAGRNAGGDDDIPYRERLKDRQTRLNAEAEKRGQRTEETAADLGGASDDEDVRQAEEMRDGGGEEDYYEIVAAKSARKKADKVAFVEAQKLAARQGGTIVPEETVGLDGKRKITYAIEKNKGLTPHRKKEVRNPRVKKRKKFDEKKKKLSSIKPVYKGGEGRGGYGGELTGIKKGLVKSTKL